MLMIVVIVVGALFGAGMGHDGGAVFGAVIAALALRSWRQQRELRALRQALDERTGAPVAEAAGPGAALAQPTVADVAPASGPIEPVAVAPSQPVPEPVIEPVAEPVVAAVAAPEQPPVPPAPARGLLAPLRDWFFGGNTIVKAGVGILFLGLAFLAKYASEHVDLPVEFRLAGIAGAAIVLLVVGWRLRTKRPGYAQVLQGGAVAVLYLTLFVAFKFYGVLSVGPVFALMVVVAALAAALAVLQDAQALAVIGALGGFATPLLVSTGSGSHIALFSYYLVLDFGIVAVAWFRTWRLLNIVGFAGTFLVGAAWGVLRYEPADYASAQAFLIAFFLLFVLVLMLPARRSAETAQTGDRWINGSLLFGLPTIAFALQYGLVHDNSYAVALSALVLAAFYVALALWMRGKPQLGTTFEATLAIGTVFLTLVIPFALDARSTAGAWSLEGAGLVWLGWRQQRRLPRAFGYALLALAGIAMLIGHDHHGLPSSPWNAVLFNALMAGAGSIAAAYFVHQHAAGRREAIASPLLIAWALLWWLSAAAIEIDAFVPSRFALAAWIGVLSGIALVHTLLADRLRWPGISRPVHAHAPLLLALSALSALLQTNPLLRGGWWAWPLALGVHALVLARAVPLWPPGGRVLAHATGALLVATLAALLGRALTSDWGDAGSAWPWLGWLVGPALLLLVLPRPALALRWPVRAEPRAYQTIAAGVLCAALLAWALLANIASTGSARPLPYLPLANPLDLGIALALAAVALWARSPVAAGVFAQPAALPALLGGVGFLALNGMLVRSFHHWAGVPYTFDGWSDSLAVQTGLTLLWSATALALMWLAARRRWRGPWLAGAALLALVVLKLMLVDLSGTGTVTRIVSFIGVGLLMLVIGYVAPLPAAGRDIAAKEEPHAA